MAILQLPKVDDVELTLQQDVANAVFTIEFDINWSEFDQLTNLAYTEVVKLVGNDPNRQQDLFTGPILANGISSNGEKTTHRVHGDFTIPWSDLDEDPGAGDEIVAVVTLTPRLPVPVTAQSDVLDVVSP
ncbi:MAG TPA: hypothetical protein VFH30_05235 [Acidimicrobiales bacterium]|nr:hypothetical protein [Acidimicrobiales bacterium]